MQEQEQTPNVESKVEPTEAAPPVELDPVKVQECRAKLERQQNLPAGVVAGLAAAIVGAVIWAVITVMTKFQIGWMAVGVGFLVGFAVRFVGRGITRPFAVAGCLLALVGCLLGNLLSMCGFIATEKSVPLLDVLSRLNPELAVRLLTATFSPMDLLFYGIALYAGYQYSTRRITSEELQSMMKEKS